MKISRIFFITLLLLLSQALSAQKNNHKLSLALENHIMIAGSMNTSYDFLTGIKGKYYLHPKNKWSPFLAFGGYTDLANMDATLFASDLLVGFQFKPFQRFSFQLGAGSMYVNESHAFQLLERTDRWQNSFFAVTSDFNFTYHFSNHISTYLILKQINLDATSVGLGFNLSF